MSPLRLAATADPGVHFRTLIVVPLPTSESIVTALEDLCRY